MRSLRNRLALLFFTITGLALGGVYLYVVPPLEDRLRNDRLRGLRQDAGTYTAGIVRAIDRSAPQRQLDSVVRQAADLANARVTLLAVRRGNRGLEVVPRSDSTTEVAIRDLSFAIADDAVREGRTVTATEPTSTGRLGQAARPLRFDGEITHVVVYSEPLREVQRNVDIIRRQMAIAGAIALVVATLAGYLLAGGVSRRMKRLERAAEQVAAGDFSQPVPVDSDDELGRLALAFNDMQRQLAQLDDARKQFIATASHELRTPIFSLAGFAELLRDEDLDEETRRHFLDQISEQTERLRKLATELLDLSRLEAGSLELRPERVDVADLTRAVTGEFTPALVQHGSELSLDLDGAPADLLCDPDRVAQIIRILIDNALAHTPPGTDIAVTATRANGAVQLAVRDNGLGIKRAVIGRIFEPFFTSDDVGGSGLGLTIAHELAERMDGRLAVDSVPGRTTFTLELPAR